MHAIRGMVGSLLQRTVERGRRKLLKVGRRLRSMLPSEPVRVQTVGNDVLRSERHVFIFGVSGRSSTTALQRILNSSHEVSVWGEPGDHVIDDVLALLRRLQLKNDNPEFEVRKTAMLEAFAKRDHSLGHALAFPDQQLAIDKLAEAFGAMFAPAIDVKRFGFKEITVRGPETLQTLCRVFPRAQVVYIFRDPRQQWPSVAKMGWAHVKTLDLFLAEYERLAGLYLEHGGAFVESDALRSLDTVQALTQHLGLSSFDTSLVDDGVFSMRDKPKLTDEERQQIEGSGAWALYERMRGEASKLTA